MIQPEDNIKLHLNMIKEEFIEKSRFEQEKRRKEQETSVSPLVVTAA